MTTNKPCFLCGSECEYEWSSSLPRFYTGTRAKTAVVLALRCWCGREAETYEIKKVAMFANRRHSENAGQFVLYKDESELGELSRDCVDLLKWDDLIPTLEENGAIKKRRIGF